MNKVSFCLLARYFSSHFVIRPMISNLVFSGILLIRAVWLPRGCTYTRMFNFSEQSSHPATPLDVHGSMSP
jgi:hypothetical protein